MFRTLSFEKGSQTSQSGSIAHTNSYVHSYNGPLLLAYPEGLPPSASHASMESEAPTFQKGSECARRRRSKRVDVACARCRVLKSSCSGKPPDNAEDTRCKRCITGDVPQADCDFQRHGTTHAQTAKQRAARAHKGSQKLHGSPKASREQEQQEDGSTFEPKWNTSRLNDSSSAYPTRRFWP